MLDRINFFLRQNDLVKIKHCLILLRILLLLLSIGLFILFELSLLLLFVNFGSRRLNKVFYCVKLNVLYRDFLKVTDKFGVDFKSLLIVQVESIEDFIKMFNESSKRWDFFLILNDGDSFFDDPFFKLDLIGAFKDIWEEFNF
jgi:hypothetical protein